jgi:hypothetical protein
MLMEDRILQTARITRPVVTRALGTEVQIAQTQRTRPPEATQAAK